MATTLATLSKDQALDKIDLLAHEWKLLIESGTVEMRIAIDNYHKKDLHKEDKTVYTIELIHS